MNILYVLVIVCGGYYNDYPQKPVITANSGAGMTEDKCNYFGKEIVQALKDKYPKAAYECVLTNIVVK